MKPTLTLLAALLLAPLVALNAAWVPMPSAPDNHDAHDYAERFRERLPRRL